MAIGVYDIDRVRDVVVLELEFDDAPGGVLVGLLLIIGAVALSLKAANLRR